MKPIVLSLLLVLGTCFVANADIVPGDVVVIDFGRDSDITAGNWNNISNSGANGENTFGTMTGVPVNLAMDLVRFSDNAMTGVSLEVAGGASTNSGIGGAVVASVGSSASFTSTGVIPDSAQVDTSFVNSNTVSFTFVGVNPTLNPDWTYNVEILSNINADRNAQDITIGGTAISVEPDDNTFVTAYNGLSTDANGNLVIEFSSAGGGANLQHINAIEITANPANTVLLGDVNMDGVVDFFDIQPFIELLSSQTFQLEGDIDGNGEVDFFDIQPFIMILSGP